MRIANFLLPLVLVLATACAAPPNGESATGASSGAESETPAAPVAPEDTRLPPTEADPELTKATEGGRIGVVDYSCQVDSDCAVKNVGNCCGYYPACVNVDSPTFPEQVQAECEREGRMSICGYPEIRGCRCVEQRCEAIAGPAAALE